MRKPLFSIVAFCACTTALAGETVGFASGASDDDTATASVGFTSGSGESGPQLPSPYPGTPGEADEPALTSDQVAEVLATGLQRFVALEPDGVVTAVEELAVFEDGCPESLQVLEEEDQSVLSWYTEGCTTSQGLTIIGPGRVERYWNRIGSDERVSQGAILAAQGDVFRLEQGNRWIEIGGYMAFERSQLPTGETEGFFYLELEAESDAETAVASPLLEPQVSARGYVFASQRDDGQLIGASGTLSDVAAGLSAIALIRPIST